jgi:hypothetical protein
MAISLSKGFLICFVDFSGCRIYLAQLFKSQYYSSSSVHLAELYRHLFSAHSHFPVWHQANDSHSANRILYLHSKFMPRRFSFSFRKISQPHALVARKLGADQPHCLNRRFAWFMCRRLSKDAGLFVSLLHIAVGGCAYGRGWGLGDGIWMGWVAVLLHFLSYRRP